MAFHTVIVAGNVGRDAELRYSPSGQPVASFSVATNRQYTASSGEQVKETIWFRISAWGKQAEICNQYVKKGMKVLVEGRLTADGGTGGPRIWSADDGSPRASFEVTAATVRFLSSRGEVSNNGGGGYEDPGDMLPPEDEIPF
jgi:single-strand DNA-binding protein